MKLRTTAALLLLAVLAAVVHWAWFLTLRPITHGDWGYQYQEAQKELLDLPRIWDPHDFGRIDLTGPTHYPIHLARGVLAHLFSESIIERLLILFPLALLLPFGSFFLVRAVTGSIVGGVIGSLVYSYNTYLFVSGNLLLLVAFALFPIALLLFMRALERARISYAVLAGLVLFLLGSYEFRALYIVFWILGFYVLYHILAIQRPLGVRGVVQTLTIASLPLFVVIGLNAYWLIGFLQVDVLATNEIFERGLFGNEFLNLTRALALFHPFWTGGSFSAFVINPIPPYLWVVPIASLLGLIFNSRKKYLYFFAVLVVLGVFFTKQVSPPFSEVYPWLYENLPGFNAFREASKFYMVIAVGYAVLTGAFIAWLWKAGQTIPMRPLLAPLVTVALAVCILWTVRPVLSGEVGTVHVPRAIPDAYQALNDLISRGGSSGLVRVLWIPRDSRWMFESRNLLQVASIEFAPVWESAFGIPRLPIQNELVHPLRRSFSDSLFDRYGIRYVGVPYQDVMNDDDFFIHYGGREDPAIRRWYVEELRRTPWLTEVPLGRDDIHVFENTGVFPYIYGFDRLNRFPSLGAMDARYEFLTTVLEEEVDFIQSEEAFDFPTELVRPVFSGLSPEQIQDGKIIAEFTEANTVFRLFLPHSSYKVDKESQTVTIDPREGQSDGTIDREPQVLRAPERLFVKYVPEIEPVNYVRNHSFERGSWQESVGDCNAYDNEPILGMSVVTDATDGTQALELSATRHIACVNQEFSVEGGRPYLFSFDYRVVQGTNAGFYIGFNDKEVADKTGNVSERIKTMNDDWYNYSRILEIPPGTDSATIYLYAYAGAGESAMVVRYDNVQLIPLPADIMRYWIVSESRLSTHDRLQMPESVDFENVNPTKKVIQIRGATTPFYLAMSEAYHPEWRVLVAAKHSGSFDLNAWSPWADARSIPETEHFELNGFANGWYVNIDRYCREQNVCERNPDGSFDLDLMIEFWPQRWVYVGLLVSIATMLASLTLLLFARYSTASRR